MVTCSCIADHKRVHKRVCCAHVSTCSMHRPSGATKHVGMVHHLGTYCTRSQDMYSMIILLYHCRSTLYRRSHQHHHHHQRQHLHPDLHPISLSPPLHSVCSPTAHNATLVPGVLSAVRRTPCPASIHSTTRCVPRAVCTRASSYHRPVHVRRWYEPG